MAHTPKYGVREVKKTGVLDEKRFFMLLSHQCDFVEPKIVKKFYMGLVRHLTGELRKNGIVRLPHLGDIALVKKKDGMGWAGKHQVILKGQYLLKFYSCKQWRTYFSKLGQRDGLEGALDPREKLLNKDLVE